MSEHIHPKDGAFSSDAEIKRERIIRRAAHLTTAAMLDVFTKRGCSNPKCTTPPEEHEELYITPACHPEEKFISAFYDRVSKEICFACPVCDRGIIKVKVQ
jgi:hypothetical protein